MFANFVTTLDGLVSYGVPGAASARFISRGNVADRFVMGLLRAAADAVISGAGTLRAEGRVTWAPEQIFPAAADLYREIRRARGLPERTSVAILSRSGDVDLDAAVFRSPDVEATVVTTAAGAARMGRGDGIRVITLAADATTRDAVDALAEATGGRLILSEAGPTIFGRMLAERAVDELFVTVAPHLAGRSAVRPGVPLVEATAFEPDSAPWADLVSAKRAGGFLMLRYALAQDPAAR